MSVTFALGKTIELRRRMAIDQTAGPLPTEAVNIREGQFDRLVDRRIEWGNPFAIGNDGSREDVIRKYRSYLVRRRDLLHRIWNGELKGKRLGCWCAPLPCHAAELAYLSDATYDEFKQWVEAVYATEE